MPDNKLIRFNLHEDCDHKDTIMKERYILVDMNEKGEYLCPVCGQIIESECVA